MAIKDDFSVAANGDIRYVGLGTNYTVIAFHRMLGDLMDDAQASGNDILDITDATAAERSTDNYITLNSPYNIDDEAAKHLYDGSVVQGVAGAEIYDGIVVYAPTGTYVYIMQNGNIVSPNFWTTGLNADATKGISHRFMLKVRTGGTDIDDRKLLGLTRETGYTNSEFLVNGTSRGNNTIALSKVDDLNDETAVATIKSWTTITNTEGYRAIDVTGDQVVEYYYSEWNKASYTINQLYEKLKWLSARSTTVNSCTNTGSNFAIGNATITGQGQSFANDVNANYLTRVFASNQPVTGVARKSSGTPYYKTGIINDTIGSTTGLNATVILVSDE